MNDNPILNNPYDEPLLHYATDADGSLNYQDVREARRVFATEIQPAPTRQVSEQSAFEVNDSAAQYGDHLVNLCRKEVGGWRNAKYPNTTRVTKELLNFWFDNPERHEIKKLFFAQREAIETAVWLNEVAEKSNPGQDILGKLRGGQQSVSSDAAEQLPRIAFKMATGTGKTVVMGCFIVYHYFNRQEYRNDTRFADYFLIVTPGVTIKDRLGVLFVDTKNRHSREDYYHIRRLVPENMEHRLENLNSRLVITNYHAFEPKALQGNKRSPFDGKVDSKGNKIGNTEDFSQLIKRVLSKFKQGSRLLILNDEAHHCYLPKSGGKTEDSEDVNENERAAVWFNGIKEIFKRFKVQNIYDLSATPYYLKGSGYAPYSLFPWVVSDFGLIEAIESGLVKIPFLPESDNTQELTMPVLRNLYDHVKDELPKKGQRKKKSEAREEGSEFKELPPKLPDKVKAALDQFYAHYREYFDGRRKLREEGSDLFSAPPVFIVVCNNTSVSKELYKYIAGYEYENSGEFVVASGQYNLFSNYDYATIRLLRKPPTLLIDSDALENSAQVNDDFKKIFSSEIKEFKKDYATIHGQGSAEGITDAQILREVVNTVGRKGKLGAHIRCVVSVSMLTEGWDANTVTHIMGLRAFGSQLLCEQVAGRALRRMNYYLKTYRKDTGGEVEEKDRHKFKPENLVQKFPPEYAYIIGVPFKMFKGGKTEPPPSSPDLKRIFAVPERQAKFEITFPNVIGYRVENTGGEIKFDFSGVENFEIDCSKFPHTTVMASAFLSNEEKLKVQTVFEKRKQEIVFLLTKELIKYHFSDDDHNPQFYLFPKLKRIAEWWYDNKILPVGERDEKFKKLIFFSDSKTIADHIRRGINPHDNTEEFTRPVVNFHNKSGSTKYVNGNTSREVYPTEKSHVNAVVMDSDWEAIAAKTLEQLPQVESYVKNQFLGFAIPYVKDGKDRQYFPDFIVRVGKEVFSSQLPVPSSQLPVSSESAKNQPLKTKNLIIEISGMSKDKAEKKWFVENKWLPAVNSSKDKYGEWHFIEIANDIRYIKAQLEEKIEAIS